MPLLEALRQYGVEISRSQEDEVKEDLLAYALVGQADYLVTGEGAENLSAGMPTGSEEIEGIMRRR